MNSARKCTTRPERLRPFCIRVELCQGLIRSRESPVCLSFRSPRQMRGVLRIVHNIVDVNRRESHHLHYPFFVHGSNGWSANRSQGQAAPPGSGRGVEQSIVVGRGFPLRWDRQGDNCDAKRGATRFTACDSNPADPALRFGGGSTSTGLGSHASAPLHGTDVFSPETADAVSIHSRAL
jgi:hypothetical protein